MQSPFCSSTDEGSTITNPPLLGRCLWRAFDISPKNTLRKRETDAQTKNWAIYAQNHPSACVGCHSERPHMLHRADHSWHQTSGHWSGQASGLNDACVKRASFGNQEESASLTLMGKRKTKAKHCQLARHPSHHSKLRAQVPPSPPKKD